MKGLFGKKTTTGTTKKDLVKDEDYDSSENEPSTTQSNMYGSASSSGNNSNNSNNGDNQVVKRGGVQSLFKKGLTAGKHKLLQSIGKADEIEHTQDYNEHNALFKDTLTHYKEMDKAGKKIIKSCEAVASAEEAISTQFRKHSEAMELHTDIETDNLTSLRLAMASVSDAFGVLASLRESLQSNISVDYLNQVHECMEEADLCKEVKDSYRECLIEQNVEFNKLKSLREKSNDLVRVKNQENVHEKRVKMSEQVHEFVMKEFTYQEKLMEREYANSIRQLIGAYRNYFLSGAEVLNNLESELLATTVTPIAEPPSSRSYNLKDLDRVMSKQTEQSKTIISRAEILEKRRVFGVELSVVNKREHSYIPKIMTDLITYIEVHALDVEGIFRLAAGVPGLNKLKRLYDGGQVIDLDRLIQQREIDIHVVACLLKLYLRELPTPVVPYELYDSFLAVMETEDDDARVQEIARLLQQMPHHNILLLDRILQMLTTVAQHSKVNLMHESNLSIVFGVNLLKSTDNNPLRVAKDNASVNKVCEIMIKNYPDRLSGTFRALTSMSRQTRELEIRQELDEDKRNNQNDDSEPIRSTAVQVIAKEQLLPPPVKPVVENPVKKMLPTAPLPKAMPPIPQRRAGVNPLPPSNTQPSSMSPRRVMSQPPQVSNPFEEYGFEQSNSNLYPSANDDMFRDFPNVQQQPQIRRPNDQTQKSNRPDNPYASNPYANSFDDDPF